MNDNRKKICYSVYQDDAQRTVEKDESQGCVAKERRQMDNR
jgi:hypothetical protein